VTIMRAIYQFWHDPCPPEWVNDLSLLWKINNPGYSYKLFNVYDAIEFIGDYFGKEILAAFLDVRLAAMASDIFRVALILQRGGVYVDMATQCRAPLDSWINLDNQLVLLRRPHMTPPLAWNGFIAASSPENHIMREIWRRISASILLREGSSVWGTTGPKVFRDVLALEQSDYSRYVIDVESVSDKLVIGSSSSYLPKGSHWSLREKTEQLYSANGIYALAGPR